MTDTPPNARDLADSGGAEIVADDPVALADAIGRALADEGKGAPQTGRLALRGRFQLAEPPRSTPTGTRAPAVTGFGETMIELVCPACHGSLERSPRAALPCVWERLLVLQGVALLLPAALSEQQSSQAMSFDEEFAGYVRYRLDHWRRAYFERIWEALELDTGSTYLDVGSGGSGVNVIEAARRGVRAFGGDISVTGVRRAASFGATEGVADHATFVACAAEQLPFRSDTFDACSAIATLEHIDDDVAALTELARVVRDGARVWLTVPLAYRYMPPPAWPWYWLQTAMGQAHYDEDRMVTAPDRPGSSIRDQLHGTSVRSHSSRSTAWQDCPASERVGRCGGGSSVLTARV